MTRTSGARICVLTRTFGVLLEYLLGLLRLLAMARLAIGSVAVLDVGLSLLPLRQNRPVMNDNWTGGEGKLATAEHTIYLCKASNYLRQIGAYRCGGQDIHARRGVGQHLAGRIDLHGRDARIGQHPQ